MSLGKSEIKLIETKILEKMTAKSFRFDSVEITENAGRLSFKFTNVTHSVFKNVEILSHDSWYKDTVVFTKIEVRLRFLYNNRKSPIIGHNLCAFKLSL